jgi:hypothetical protein
MCSHLELRLDVATLELASLLNVSADPDLSVPARTDRGLLPLREVRHVGHVGKDLPGRAGDLDRDLEPWQR